MNTITAKNNTQAADQTAMHDATAEKEVLTLIDESTTMPQEEKDSWKALLPQMNDNQVAELKRILETEKQKLEEIDNKYKKEIKRLEKDYIENYLTRKSRQKWQEARDKEASSREESEDKADELLSLL